MTAEQINFKLNFKFMHLPISAKSKKQKLESKMLELFIEIDSNGSKWFGEPPDSIESLLSVLNSYPLDRAFEKYCGVITKNPICDRTHNPLYPQSETVYEFFGNFLGYSHVFRIFTNDPDVYEPLKRAIELNQQREDYLTQDTPKFYACDLEEKFSFEVESDTYVDTK